MIMLSVPSVAEDVVSVVLMTVPPSGKLLPMRGLVVTTLGIREANVIELAPVVGAARVAVMSRPLAAEVAKVPALGTPEKAAPANEPLAGALPVA
jgi:hypothetical protein